MDTATSEQPGLTTTISRAERDISPAAYANDSLGITHTVQEEQTGDDEVSFDDVPWLEPFDVAPSGDDLTALHVTDRWTGVVTEVGEDYFVGELYRTSGSGERLVADFSHDVVTPEDQALLEVGAWFYVTYGTLSHHGRRRSSVASIRFRRMPAWRQSELDLVRRRAEERASHIDAY